MSLNEHRTRATTSYRVVAFCMNFTWAAIALCPRVRTKEALNLVDFVYFLNLADFASYLIPANFSFMLWQYLYLDDGFDGVKIAFFFVSSRAGHGEGSNRLLIRVFCRVRSQNLSLLSSIEGIWMDVA